MIIDEKDFKLKECNPTEITSVLDVLNMDVSLNSYKYDNQINISVFEYAGSRLDEIFSLALIEHLKRIKEKNQ